MSDYTSQIASQVVRQVLAARQGSDCSVEVEISAFDLAYAVFDSLNSNARKETNQDAIEACVHKYLRSRNVGDWLIRNYCEAVPLNKKYCIFVRKIEQLPEKRDRVKRGARVSDDLEWDWTGRPARDEKFGGDCVAASGFVTPEKKSKRVADKYLGPVNAAIRKEMNDTFNFFFRKPSLRTSEDEMLQYVEKVLSDPNRRNSQNPVPAYEIYLSPIDDSRTQSIRDINPSLQSVISEALVSLNKSRDDSDEYKQEIARETDAVLSHMIHIRTSGQLQTPVMQRHLLSSSSMTFAAINRSSKGGWTPSSRTCTKLINASTLAMEKCSRHALQVATAKGYIIVSYVDNYNRFMYQVSLQTAATFTTTFRTQQLVYLILGRRSADERFILNSNQPTNQQLFPVRLWRGLKKVIDKIARLGYRQYLMEAKSEYPCRCVRENPDTRMKDFIPMPSLGGSSASFEVFCTTTLPVLVGDSKVWRVTIADPEYIGHEAKIITGSSILPQNDTLTSRAAQVNILGIMPPTFHLTLAMIRLIIKFKANFHLIIKPLLGLVFPSFKKNFIKMMQTSEVESKRKTRELDNDLDEADSDDENGDEAESKKTKKKSSKKRPIEETTILNDDNEQLTFYMSFMRCYVLMEILLMEYDAIKDNTTFTGPYSEFMTSFFDVELRLVVAGLSDWREGVASTMLSNIPIITHYFAMTNHPNMVYTCLFLQNNLDYWSSHHPEIINTLCMNCDYFSDEHIELINGGVASSGHLNRKNKEDAFYDPVRMFALSCENFEGVMGEGEILRRTRIKGSDRMKDTKREVRQFISNLASGRIKLPIMSVKPFTTRLVESQDSLKQYIADYTRHFSASMFKTAISGVKCTPAEMKLKKLIYYRPLFKKLVKDIKSANSVLNQMTLVSCLEDDELDFADYCDLLESSNFFRKDSKGVPGKFHLFELT